jgi:CheY-like chemotaxis protein
MEAGRIFVLEDDPDNLALVLAILQEKYFVQGFGSVKEALLALEHFKPDLFVLDIGMRPVDGVEFLHSIRALPGHESIPAIALTGYARDEDKEKYLSAGFQSVVTKPILNRGQLESVVESLLKSPS